MSVFYLIPQMVGAGALIKPLLGFDPWVGVLIVGAVVTLIVVTAGMVSTTWVQFIKGSLLVIFCLVLTVMILVRGFDTQPRGVSDREFVPFRIEPRETFSDATEMRHAASRGEMGEAAVCAVREPGVGQG